MGLFISLLLGACTTKVPPVNTSSPLGTLSSPVANESKKSPESQKNPGSSTAPHIMLFHSDRTGDYQIYTSDPLGKNAKQLTNSAGRNIEPSFSPDGTLIAFASSRDDENGLKLFLMNSDGTNQKVLIDHPGYALSPKWSPDGKMLIFYANWDGHFQLYTADIATGNYTPFLSTANVDYLPSWSPNGREVAFTSQRGSSEQIYILNQDKSETAISSGPEWAWRAYWSPDGTKIAYFKWTSSHGDIFVFDINKNVTTQLTSTNDHAEQNPSWSPDGTQIYFEADSTPSLISIYRMNADGSNVEQITNEVDGNCGYPSLH